MTTRAFRNFARCLGLVGLIATPAGAHSPHDVAPWVAASPGSAPRWVAAGLERSEGQYIIRTGDLGGVLQTRYLLPGAVEVECGAFLGEERLLVGTRGEGLWISEDACDSLDLHGDLPASATVNQLFASPAVVEDGLALAVGNASGLGTIWRTTDAGLTWTEAWSSAGLDVVDLELSPDFDADGRVFAVTSTGVLLRSTDRGVTWIQGGSIGDTAADVAVDSGSRVWVAGRGTGLWGSTDDGDTLQVVAFEGQWVSTIVGVGGGVVLAALPSEPGWRSADGGATWEVRADGILPPGGGYGNPTDGNHYYELERTGDGAVLLASWEGMARTDDGGLTWTTIETYLPEVMRDVALTRGPSGSLAVSFGSNGGCAELVEPGTGEAWAIGAYLTRPWPRNHALTEDWGRDGTGFVTLSGGLDVTTDGGQDWKYAAEPQRGGVEDVSVNQAWQEDPTVIQVGVVGDGAGYCLSRDGTATWACANLHPAGDPCSCDAVNLSPAWTEDGRAWLGCCTEGAIFGTADHGGTWTKLGEIGDYVYAVDGTPEGEILFVAGTDGVWVSREDGALTRVAFEGQAVFDLDVAADWARSGAVAAVVPGDGWYLSQDRGATWAAMTLPTEDVAVGIALSPTFADDGILAVATFNGGWWSTDRGRTWHQVHVIEVLNVLHVLWTVGEEWTLEQAARGIQADSHTTQTVGATASLRFRGVAIDVASVRAEACGTARVTIDGVEVGTASCAGEAGTSATVLSAAGLADAWHTLELTVEEAPFSLDGAIVYRQVLEPVEDLPDTGFQGSEGDTGEEADTGHVPGSRCPGCAGAGSAGPAFLIPFWLLVARRRRRR